METTGLSPTNDRIIEIGAVRIKGGEVLGTFSTLIDPERLISAEITAITGIKDSDVDGKPTEKTVIPEFLDFAKNAVLVAHNAKFDLGFLEHTCHRIHHPWPRPTALCTLILSRRLLTRSEVGSYALGSLARHFRAEVTPNHRALQDVYATITVFHGLIEILGSREIIHVADIDSATTVSATSTRKRMETRKYRHLLDGVPEKPGIYIFRSKSDEPLYIGTAVNLRRRIRQYVNGSDRRRKIEQLLPQTSRVEIVECTHGFEAAVREAELIARLRPPFNRRSKEPRRHWWITEPSGKKDPRRAVITRTPQAQRCLGPFSSRKVAASVCEILGLGPDPALPQREIATHLTWDAQTPISIRLYELLAGDQRSESRYSELISIVERLGESGRYQRAALTRDTVAQALAAIARFQELSALASVSDMTISAPDGHGGWNIAILKYGRLAGTGNLPRGTSRSDLMNLFRQQASHIEVCDEPFCGANIESLKVINFWLSKPGVRPGPGCDDWVMPIFGARRYSEWIEMARRASEK